MDKNRLRLCVSAGDSSTATEEWLWYFAYCNFNTSGVKSFADDLAVRNGPVSSRVALLLRSAEGKPSFASISQCEGLRLDEAWLGMMETVNGWARVSVSGRGKASIGYVNWT